MDQPDLSRDIADTTRPLATHDDNDSDDDDDDDDDDHHHHPAYVQLFC